LGKTTEIADGRFDRRLDAILPDRHRFIMDAISFANARENLAATMDKVCADHAPVVITRDRDQPVVMISLDDYESLEETAYLLRSPANARRLLEAIHALESGQGTRRDIDLDA
jgi:antitoxin YefM